MTINFKYITINQPIGTFYVAAVRAVDLIRITEVNHRGKNPYGVQRNPDNNRIAEIAEYCKQVDATFPTSIIVSVYSNVEVEFQPHDINFTIPDGYKLGNVIDGQHRLLGLKRAEIDENFILPVVFMFDMQLEEEAYVFSIINSKQTKVSSSLLADLFGVTSHRSPQKVAHFIAKALNQDEESPLKGMMKMLGKKDVNQDIATISQGTFVDHFCKLILTSTESNRKTIDINKDVVLNRMDRKIFRNWYIEEKDALMYKVILNCLIALRKVFEAEYNDVNHNILWKSTGICGILKALEPLANKGKEEGSLKVEFFERIFSNYKYKNLNGRIPTSQMYGSGEANQKRLAEDILKANGLL